MKTFVKAVIIAVVGSVLLFASSLFYGVVSWLIKKNEE